MRKKSLPVLLIIALMLVSSILINVKAFDTPPSSPLPNPQFSPYGPRASQLIMKSFFGNQSEYGAFASRQVDFMDEFLTLDQYNETRWNPNFTTGNVTTDNIREFDMNCYVAPFNNTFFRKGLSSLIDRNEFLDTYFPSGGVPAYSPLPVAYGWSDPALGPPAYYQKDFQTAYLDFCLTYGAPIPDPLRPGYSTWNFPNPYPTNDSNPNPTPYDDSGPSIGQNQILFYIRTEQQERRNSGVYLVDQAENQLPAWAQTNQGDSVFTTYPLPEIGGVKQWPALNFYNHGVFTAHTVTNMQVMRYYRFQLYTGGWTTNLTPDFLDIWKSENAPLNTGWAPFSMNYNSFLDPLFTTEVNNMETVISVGDAGTYGTVKYWANQAQERIMDLAGVIPLWIYSDYTACLTADNNAINAKGSGFCNWWDMFNAYPGPGAPGFATNTLTAGLSHDITNPNPITTPTYYGGSDRLLTAQIYDSLLISSPYDTTQLNMALADNYSLSQTEGVNGGNTVFLAHLRSNVFWQDIPYRNRTAFTVDNGHELDGPFQNVPLTPLDVAFTIQYLRDMGPFFYTDNGYYLDHVNSVVVSSAYQSTWPYSNPLTYPTGPPWENATWIASPTGGNVSGYTYQRDFVQFDPALDIQTIKINTNDRSGSLRYYKDFQVSIFPMHLFSHIAMASWPNSAWPAGTPNVLTINLLPPEIKVGGADLLYGTGPWILTGGTLGDHYTLLPYRPGTTYGPMGFTVIENNGYFALGHDLAVVSLNPSQRLVMSGAIINITVCVQNQGVFYPEGSNLTLYAGSTPLGARWTGFLNSTQTAWYGFSWNTSTFLPGCYFLRASLTPVPAETDLSDNNLVNGTVVIGVETPTGTNVSVAPASNAQVTFTETTATGITTLNVTQPTSAAITGAANSVFVDITTNATYSGNITLRFTYNASGLTLEAEQAMRMWLWNTTSSRWVDITSSVDTDNNIVYGVSPHLSMFGITCTLSLAGNDGYYIPTTVGTPPSPPPLPYYREALAYFDILATAPYASPVTVRLGYDPSTISMEQAQFLQMWTWDGAKWVDITSQIDTINHVVYGVSLHLSMFGITTFNPDFAASVGITGYKLVFRERMNNPFSLSSPVNYYWSFSAEKWNGAQWVSSGISGSSTPVVGYMIPALTTLILPCYVYPLGSSAVMWGNWLRISYTFHWTFTGTDYSTDYTGKLHVHPGDIGGGSLTFPYLGADAVCDISDGAAIGANWQKAIPPTIDPTSLLARADITGDGFVDISDGAVIGLNWQKTWTNTPPG